MVMCFPAVAVIPPLLWLWSPRWLGTAHEAKSLVPFELLAFTFSVATAWATATTWRRFRLSGSEAIERWLPVVVFALVGFWCAVQIQEFSIRSYDYDSYDREALLVLQGLSPYGVPANAYPPLLAQIMAGLYSAIEYGLGRADLKLASGFVFYLYQALQLICLAALYPTLFRLMRKWSVTIVPAAVTSAAVLMLSVPRLMGMFSNQLILMVVMLTLLVVLFPDRPLIAGSALALGIHLKLYPVILLPAVVLFGYWSTAVATVIFGLVPFALPHTIEWWREMIPLAKTLAFPMLYNTSLWTFVYEALALVGVAAPTATAAAFFVHRLWSLALGLWLVQRVWKRRQIGEPYVLAACDALAFAALISPVAWVHAYHMVTPLALWALVSAPAERRSATWAAIAAIFLLPTLTIFPLNHLRLVATVALIVMTSPGARVAQARFWLAARG